MNETKALDGLKILELGMTQTVPGGTRCLADFGAQVVKVESTDFPDVLRLAIPRVKGVSPLDDAPGFCHFNTSKMDLTLDLKKREGVEIFKKLVKWADVVAQNQRPGIVEKYGLGYEELRKIKPDIIMLSASIMGQEGPGVQVGGWGTNTAAVSGMVYLTRYSPDDEPLLPGRNLPTDAICSLFVPIAILSALEYRRRTGKGQHIDLTQIETFVHFLGPGVLDYSVNKRVQEPVGNRDPYVAPHGAYRCQGDDEWCAIAVFNQDEWRAFCAAIDSPTLADDPRFATLEKRKQHEEELDRIISDWTINYPPLEVMTRLQKAGIAAGMSQDIDDILEHDPQVKERAVYRKIEHPLIGEFIHPAWPFILPQTPCEVRHAPLIGEHNEYVCTKILGMSDTEFVELVNKKVIH